MKNTNMSQSPFGCLPVRDTGRTNLQGCEDRRGSQSPFGCLPVRDSFTWHEVRHQLEMVSIAFRLFACSGLGGAPFFMSTLESVSQSPFGCLPVRDNKHKKVKDVFEGGQVSIAFRLFACSGPIHV